MAVKLSMYELEGEPITLQTPDSGALTVKGTRLSLWIDEANGALLDCELDFTVSKDQYQLIDSQALFNLDPRMRNPGGDFEPEGEIEIEAHLDKEFIPDLGSEASEAIAAKHLLMRLSEEEPDHPLVSTVSWFALYVKQEVPLPPELAEEGGTVKMGYSTKWTEVYKKSAHLSSLWETMLDFFREDRWPYTREGGLIETLFQGDHGKWTCYCQARDDEQIYLFHSVYPHKIPEARRTAVLEFITWVNWDLPMGNFEMNLKTGELRFKTSIDVEGAELSQALVKQMAYANVNLMDQYLPGINAVLKGVSVQQALDSTEEDTEE